MDPIRQHSVLVGKLADRVHMRGMPVQMYRKNGFRAARDGSLHGLDVYRVSARINVDQYRVGANVGNAQCRGDETVGGSNDFVAWAEIKRTKSEFKRSEERRA